MSVVAAGVHNSRVFTYAGSLAGKIDFLFLYLSLIHIYLVDLFEGQYEVPGGMSYNSYIITDEKCVVMDTVDQNFTEHWLDNIENILGGKAPDYLVVHHMEPDQMCIRDRFHTLLQRYCQYTKSCGKGQPSPWGYR